MLIAAVSEKSEVRKIQFTGRSMYILSLPKRWMHEMHLKAGVRITIVRESNNTLSIVPNDVTITGSNREITALMSQDESGSCLKRIHVLVGLQYDKSKIKY